MSDRAPLAPARLPAVDLLTRYTVAESRAAMLESFERLEEAYARAVLVGV